MALRRLGVVAARRLQGHRAAAGAAAGTGRRWAQQQQQQQQALHSAIVRPGSAAGSIAAVRHSLVRYSSTEAAASGGSGGGSIRSLVLFGGLFAGAGFALAYLGRPFEEEEEGAPAGSPVAGDATSPALAALKQKNYEDENMLVQLVYRARDRLQEYYTSYANPEPDILLPPPLPAYVHKASEYTLVIDLEDTLVHSEWTREHGWRTRKRPGLDFFMEYVTTRLFGEVVIFCDRQAYEVIGILDKLDPQHVTYRLFKGHQRYANGEYFKDLSLLGRDLDKVIIVDDNPEKYSLQPKNGIKIAKFEGDDSDTKLLEMLTFLEAIVQANVDDVRPVIERYSAHTDDPAGAFVQQKLAMQRAEAASGAAPGNQASPTKRGLLGSIFG